ncbi:helix-turn-helix transcriptional regulator [Saliterribacillus persicus]|uniref:Putative transcriptional regulator n=1 Tax=Saliterribacillus persicus TaxID=930114 RepID=A0A368Y2K8_9BACI|nr:helix-turn-helix transcriptional regulator [Saliterribacillus persicus]RCW73057.1 putative transcriptional regulator [Saliterribacillus persicus]
MENKMKVLRKELGFSQESLAERCEVTRQTINAIENNKYDPTLEVAFRLSFQLNTTIDDLFAWRQDR